MNYWNTFISSCFSLKLNYVLKLIYRSITINIEDTTSCASIIRTNSFSAVFINSKYFDIQTKIALEVCSVLLSTLIATLYADDTVLINKRKEYFYWAPVVRIWVIQVVSQPVMVIKVRWPEKPTWQEMPPASSKYTCLILYRIYKIKVVRPVIIWW